jgi:D-alanine--poly(phosphoribitol) ligase subunit 1
MRINVLDYLEQGALRNSPQKTAVVDGGHSCSFEELAAAAHKCAMQIIRKSAATRRPIAVFLPKSVETIVADLAILHTGNCYSNLDVKSPPARTMAILNNLAPLLIITSRAYQQQVAALAWDEERIVLIDDELSEPVAAFREELERRRNSAIDTDPVCIINTSGSTGVPKSVAMHHRSIIDFIDWVTDEFDFRATDTIGSLSPFYFDIFTLELFVSLSRGATLCLIPDGLSAFPLRLVEFLADNRVSFIFWVPSIMVQIANAKVLDKVDLTGLKKIFFAGEVFPTRSFNQWKQALPGALFVNLYGPIEITVDCTYFVVDRDFADTEPLPIGIPCRNTQILILNEENKPAAVGETGEICVRGSSLALGYWNNPERTAAAFVQNPLQTAYPELIYRTGDLAHWNDRGEILFLGRKDFQIKHLGYRIELGEIEAALSGMEAVDEACVLYNKEAQAITLFFTARANLSPGQIRQQLSGRLPKYMLPTVFRQLDEMPHNPNGKIDRNRLSEALRAEPSVPKAPSEAG